MFCRNTCNIVRYELHIERPGLVQFKTFANAQTRLAGALGKEVARLMPNVIGIAHIASFLGSAFHLIFKMGTDFKKYSL